MDFFDKTAVLSAYIPNRNIPLRFSAADLRFYTPTRLTITCLNAKSIAAGLVYGPIAMLF